MQTYLDCIPCFVRHALESARRISDDPALHESLLRSLCKELSIMDMSCSPPIMGRNIHRHIRRLTGDPDPYRELKEQFNRHAMDLLPGLRKEIQAAPDPFELAVRLAVAGNTIDFGANIEVSENLLSTVLGRAREEVFLGSITALKNAVAEADSILYLADNTGEIALDHLLLDQLPLEKVVFAVRGAPIINDATLEDALFTGITERVETIDTGSDIPGIVLSECCEEFQQAFERADLVIAKGQGNFETLNTDPSGKIFFLLMAKCPVVARDLQTRVGTFVTLAQTDLPLWNFEQPGVI